MQVAVYNNHLEGLFGYLWFGSLSKPIVHTKVLCRQQCVRNSLHFHYNLKLQGTMTFGQDWGKWKPLVSQDRFKQLIFKL